MARGGPTSRRGGACQRAASRHRRLPVLEEADAIAAPVTPPGSFAFRDALDPLHINVIFAHVTAGWTGGFIGAKVEREYIFKFAIAEPPMPAISAVHEAIVRGTSIAARDHET